MIPLFLAASGTNPLVPLAVSIVLVVLLIGVFRLHAFFSLLIAASVVALWTAGGGGWSQAIDAVLQAFGASAGGIGFSIAIAAVIGAALLESGAADRIVRSFIATLGEQRAAYALLGAGFVLGIPVFFDTVFFLLVPLARALSARTGKNYSLHLLAICAGAVVTHSTVPPTPGPLAMADIMHLDLGKVLLVGLLGGVPPALAGLWFAKWSDRRWPIALRAAPGASIEDLKTVAGKPESELPGFLASIAPVALPVILIAVTSVATSFRASVPDTVFGVLAFVGNKNVALLLGGVIAVAVYLRQKKLGWKATESVVGEPLATAGVIILITAAGGAYGAMIKNSGVGDVIRQWTGSHGVNVVLLGWAMSALLRAAQGSTTVAVITTAGLMTSMGGAQGLGVNPLFLYLAIGYGGLFMSWMNDSGFWIFSRMGGLNERETLKTWTVLLNVVSVAGLVEALVLSWVLPAH
ncbi:MAG TPA: SLC13 family permease [Opitutus sp.]|nr:SLC13 family permease [Opitutus sp.]